MNAEQFLSTVVTAEQGYFELCIRNDAWHQEWYEYPSQINEIIAAANEHKAHGDVYFSSYLFSTRQSRREYVLPSRTIQQDLDEADINTLPLVPGVLVQTSPSRHQGYWILSSESEQHEYLSKKLAYSIPNCDKSGWPLGRKVRFPDTINYKYTNGPHNITVVSTSNKRYTPDDIELLPDIDPVTHVEQDEAFIHGPHADLLVGPNELIESIKDYLSAKVYAEYIQDSPQSDRSLALFTLMVQCFKAGLTREQVYWIASYSANNKFSLLRYNAERELAKDILRAEAAVKSNALDVRALINELRKQTKTLISERRRGIYEVVLSAMKQEGDFVRTVDNRRYYIVRSQGRPLDVGMFNQDISSLLDVKYGLNKTETEHTHTLNSIISYMSTLPETAQVGALSHYDMPSNQLLIHNGRKTVFNITKERIEQTVDGSYGVVFPWDSMIEPFSPVLEPMDWGKLLFGNIPNCLNFNQEQVECVLKVWLMFCLLRNAASTRPILAFFGQPGSGKTTTASKIYAFLYGKQADVSGVTSPANFDIATANLPFFVLDNADTWERWLPDRLAQAARRTDILVRELYSNNRMLRMKRQALIAVTAHDPKFGRADVADRMLIITLQRFSNLGLDFEDESSMMNEVLRNRNKLWGAVLLDLQRILSRPIPAHTDLQLRIQDFAKLGEWISIGLNQRDLFREIVPLLRSSQQDFNITEDHALIASMTKWLTLQHGNPKPKTEDDLYEELLLIQTEQERKHFEYLFKSSSQLIKRISNLQDTLSTIMDISFSVGKSGQRLWTFKAKDQ